MKNITVLLMFLPIFVYGQIFDNDRWYDYGTGKSELMGYKFDGPVERASWRTFHYIRSWGDVTDCNSYCCGRGGRCVPAGRGADCSSWCGCGQTCQCY